MMMMMTIVAISYEIYWQKENRKILRRIFRSRRGSGGLFESLGGRRCHWQPQVCILAVKGSDQRWCRDATCSQTTLDWSPVALRREIEKEEFSLASASSQDSTAYPNRLEDTGKPEFHLTTSDRHCHFRFPLSRFEGEFSSWIVWWGGDGACALANYRQNLWVFISYWRLLSDILISGVTMLDSNSSKIHVLPIARSNMWEPFA